MNAISRDMTYTFVPRKDDTRTLRDAFGRFATGVTVVTCDSEDGPICITANSFSSLSLDPPLVMWAGDRSSRRFRYFHAARHFSVHVLSAEQAELCFGCSKDAHALREIEHDRCENGTPLLPGSLARFECEQHASHDAGDHVIVVGKVLKVSMADGDALTFYAGKLGQFAQD
ncbi:NADH-FMN oxidoreductase RutF, flavin reductase (DIM6/NTAB) family [Ruegeria halocynthiae]|uniref:NADH-FMN oxidoreductase RutF, flavin reductase (DIM6/NTAB) family n=1 Tax=Ruegeria halocynthiae TaxID=985054 RepID=A0A1H3CI23_9RHOB|nr:flavin reductase family protein [Ruegeria halocynthiae]SDX53765.1 NADH-FMN oxidoreductase RutF, flavin reductase (DIM6/NTAB) family [Ruegeria halocynthiae]